MLLSMSRIAILQLFGCKPCFFYCWFSLMIVHLFTNSCCSHLLLAGSSSFRYRRILLFWEGACQRGLAFLINLRPDAASARAWARGHRRKTRFLARPVRRWIPCLASLPNSLCSQFFSLSALAPSPVKHVHSEHPCRQTNAPARLVSDTSGSTAWLPL